MTKDNLSVIVATTRNGAIGRRGDMLFHIPADLRYFKHITMGHPVIMGRRTWESLPKGALPGRRNIVITRNSSFEAPGADVVDSLEAALQLVADADEIFVIGGGQIYAAALPLASRLYITEIDADAPADADTYFPTFDTSDFPICRISAIQPGNPAIRFIVRKRITG